jgi:hypothetical protein
METWDREELYAEVWERPLVKIAPKYGISAVALGKVCEKLQIPLPGRGYWAKKEFGKPVERLPLPEGKDLPIVHRFKFASPEDPSSPAAKTPAASPTDPEYLRIVDLESRNTAMVLDGPRHKLIKAAEKILRRVKPDEKGIVCPPYDQPCIEIRVSQRALGRALAFLNAVILCLETERFTVSVEQGKHGTSAQIFGYRVPFAIVEKLREKSRKQVKEYSWTRTAIEYEPKGELEFRVGDFSSGWKCKDSIKLPLEGQLPTCLGALLREGRSSLLRTKRKEQEDIERQIKQREMAILSQQIAEEEKKVCDLERWVSNWARANQMREFIATLEKTWTQQGHDLSPGAQKGQRILWMKEQADRLDPLIEGPPSILDRKGELEARWHH